MKPVGGGVLTPLLQLVCYSRQQTLPQLLLQGYSAKIIRAEQATAASGHSLPMDGLVLIQIGHASDGISTKTCPAPTQLESSVTSAH